MLAPNTRSAIWHHFPLLQILNCPMVWLVPPNWAVYFAGWFKQKIHPPWIVGVRIKYVCSPCMLPMACSKRVAGALLKSTLAAKAWSTEAYPLAKGSLLMSLYHWAYMAMWWGSMMAWGARTCACNAAFVFSEKKWLCDNKLIYLLDAFGIKWIDCMVAALQLLYSRRLDCLATFHNFMSMPAL